MCNIKPKCQGTIICGHGVIKRIERNKSLIHGYGIFTLELINIGNIIYTTSEYIVHSSPKYGSVQHGPFRHLIEPKVLRWLNHSCQPNAGIIFNEENLIIITTSLIKPGHEITCDYRKTEDKVPYPFICNCGNCNHIRIG